MRIQAKDTAQTAYLDDADAGEGLSIFFSQAASDIVRWRLDVYARLDSGVELAVGTFWVSPPPSAFPFDRLTRLVAIVVCPGAVSWSVTCAAQTPETNEDATIELFSSKCCTAPAGVKRVSERYSYYSGIAGGAPVAQPILAGQTITRIVANGTGAGGVSSSFGPLITLAVGQTVTLEPKALTNFGATSISFLNCNWVIEYLESA